MIARFLSILVLIWALGFALFVVTLPRPADAARTDAIVVLTGAPGRIERGFELLQAKRAERMLVSGVYREVRPRELAQAQGMPPALMACCVDLGREAVDTRSNAVETAEWIAARDYRSIRLITTDWHMPRARAELARALPGDVAVLSDAVRSRAGLTVLFKEYHKYLLSRAAPLVGL